MYKDLLKAFGSLVLKKYLCKHVELKREEYLAYYELVTSMPVVRRNIIELGGLGWELGVNLPVGKCKVRRVRVVNYL